MAEITFKKVKPNDANLIALIADCYLKEWNISKEITIQKITSFTTEKIPFQVIMYVNDIPIATGGIYTHVSLLDREPKFKVYTPWLALVYTINEYRNKGYGALLCEEIQGLGKAQGLSELFLFTHTAEKLYSKLNWETMERLKVGDKQIIVMKKLL